MTSPQRVVLVIYAAALAFALQTETLGAQTSPYVPLGDPAYTYIAALQARGALRALPLLERPLTVSAIRKALGGETQRASSPVVQAWTRRLVHAISRYAVATVGDSSAGLGYLMAPGLSGTAQTSGRRELTLADDVSAIYPGASIRGVVSAGRIAAAARLLADNSLRDDPDFMGKKDRFVRGRMSEAYVSAQWPLGELFFGRIARNWGPASIEGAHIGSAPFSYDHIFARIGVQRLNLSSVLAKLEDTPSLTPANAATVTREPTGPLAQRHLAAHRLSATVRGFELGVSESYLYSGVGRGMSFTLANPLTLYNLAQYNERESGNAAYSVDLAWRTRGPWVGAQFFLDDLQVDSCDPLCAEPNSWAGTLTVEGVPLGDAQRLFASYTRVTNLVYRTPDPTERFASFGIGLGRAYTDYDEVRIGADIAVTEVATTRLYVAKRRQGEGDYRRAFPLPADYAGTPSFLAGRTLSVMRLGLSGGASAGDFSAAWDVGANRARGRETSNGFEGRLTIRWEPEFATIRGATH